MGRDLKQGAIRQQQQNEWNKFRNHERESWNLREDERRFVLGHRAGPGRQRTGFRLAVVAGIAIPPGMEMKTPGGRLFEIDEAGMADKPGRHTNGHQQTGDEKEQRRGPPRSPTERHDVEELVHHKYSIQFQTHYHTKLPPSCLLPVAHRCYSPHRGFVVQTASPRRLATCRREPLLFPLPSNFTFHAPRTPCGSTP